MIQTRDEEDGLLAHATVEHAFNAARRDDTIWKISFDAEDGSHVRLVKNKVRHYTEKTNRPPTVTYWNYEPIFTSVK